MLSPARPRMELQSFTRADFERLIGWIPDARLLLQWAGPNYSYPLDEKQLAEDQWEAEVASPRRHRFRAVERAGGEVVGHIELIRHRDNNEIGRLARVLIGSPDLRGRGLGADMVRQVVDFGFSELELEAVDLAVYAFNKAAMACYEGIGFRRTEHRPEATQFGEETWAGYIMTMTREEWEGLSG